MAAANLHVLLTGANGFVGSHVLDHLRRRDLAVAVLLRPGRDRRFISSHLRTLDVREGSLGNPSSLRNALSGITHVIHCAGSVRSLSRQAFFEANETGTRNLVDAANECGVNRLVHLSSLAAGGPAIPDRPAAEADAPSPVSNYGHSKLAGEEAVRNGAKGEWVIIRPPAVYGPRDTEFLRLFRAVKARLLPEVGHGLPLSLVYAGDLAATTIAALTSPGLAGRVLYAAHPEIVTAGQFGACIARRLGVRAWRIPLPVPLLWSSCLAQEVFARLTGRPSVLNLQKFAELRAPGWVCEPSPVWRDIGVECTTGLEEGVEETLAWYLREGWL